MPPNILVVVLDCVRADDFPGGSNPVDGMPFVQGLRRESIVFPRAASVAPWTIPSHASLFTGLYPWEHGVHIGSGLHLDASTPTLAGLLREAGYATLSLSSNGFIGPPEFGLANGFEFAAWGDWWERYLRSPDLVDPPRATNLAPTQRLPEGPMWDSMGRRAWYTHRVPYLLDAANRVWHRVRPGANGGNPNSISPWIEPTLGRWLSSRPRETPAFVFVNLLDCHEPFLTDPRSIRGLGAWWRAAHVRMDRSSALAGVWNPSRTELDRLHELYRAMLRSMDRRLHAIVRAFEDAGRWDDTLLVITSDHGQTFGEHGHLFHGVRIWEPLLRVPLWVRLPHGDWGGREAKGWASLVDITPTALDAAGIPDTPGLAGVPLISLLDGDRGDAILAVADGVRRGDPILTRAPADRVAELNRRWVAAYQGDTKLVLDTTRDTVQAFDVARDPAETRDVWSADPGRYEPLADSARRAARQLLGQHEGEDSREVEDRLRSWGYL